MYPSNKVPTGSLNKYVTEEVGHTNGEEVIIAAWIYNTVDVGKLLYEWKEAGYPLRWSPANSNPN